MKKTYIIPSTEWRTVDICSLICTSLEPPTTKVDPTGSVDANDLDARSRGGYEGEVQPEAAEETWGQLW